MKTLLDRAKPELKKAIAVFKVDYPNSANHIEKSLSENYTISDLPYGTVNDLGAILRRYGIKFDVSFPWEHFEDIK